MTKTERDQLLSDLKQMSYGEALAYMNLLAGPPLRFAFGHIPVFKVEDTHVQLDCVGREMQVWVYWEAL
jgi:hypothetical protein